MRLRDRSARPATRRPFAAVALAAASLGALAAGLPPSAAQPALPDVLTKSLAVYAALTSYADTGTVRVDTGGTLDQSRFTTAFRRATRDLLFDYQAVSSTTVSTKYTIDMSGHRKVMWMFNGEMQSYDRASGTHEAVAPNAQVRTLQAAAAATRGASIMIPSLLYPQARMPSALLQIQEATVAGEEAVGGRRCHKVTGTAYAYYPSGQRTGVRPVSVWIDAETLLIRRVLEDTPEGYGDGKATLRLTFDYQPQANPAIDDGKFQFTIPKK